VEQPVEVAVIPPKEAYRVVPRLVDARDGWRCPRWAQKPTFGLAFRTSALRKRAT
jgi:hypothetical protein